MLLIFLTVVMGISGILQRDLSIRQLNAAALQARYYALSGIEYYKTKPNLPSNNISGIDLKKLKNAAGLTHPLTRGGFKLVKNKQDIYFIGYVGNSLSEAEAVKVLMNRGGILKVF